MSEERSEIESFQVVVCLSSREVEALVLPVPGDGSSAAQWAEYGATGLPRETGRSQMRLALKRTRADRRRRGAAIPSPSKSKAPANPKKRGKQ